VFVLYFVNNVNDKIGHIGYAAFYLASCVASGIGYVLLPQVTASVVSSTPVIGASGAVAAVTGAYLSLFPRSNITIFTFFLVLGGQFEVSSMVFIVFFFVQDVLLHLFSQSVGLKGGVAHTAHIAGMLFGFGLSLTLLWLRLLPRDQFDVLALMHRWNKRRQYHSLVRSGYNPFAPAPYKPPKPPSQERQQQLISQAVAKIQEMRAEILEAVAHHNVAYAAARFLDLKKLDANQVLSRQAQLDVANQLASQQFYLEAAEAYEAYVRCYPNSTQAPHVQLMVGVIYARYLRRYDRAKEHLNKALQRLHNEQEIAMARNELRRIESMVGEKKS
jgi:hypothetical protein